LSTGETSVSVLDMHTHNVLLLLFHFPTKICTHLASSSYIYV